MIKVIAEGEPNFWHLKDKKRWFMRIQFNGEITVQKQQELMKKISKIV